MIDLSAVCRRHLLVGAVILGTMVIVNQTVNAQRLSTTELQAPEYYILTQVLEPFDVIEIIKDAVEVVGAAAGSPGKPIPPADLLGMGFAPNVLEISGRYFTSVTIHNGSIKVTYNQPDTNENIKGRTLTLTPYETQDGTFVWRCGRARLP